MKLSKRFWLLVFLLTTYHLPLPTSRLYSAPWWDMRFTDGNNGTYDTKIEDMLESYILGASSMVYLANYSTPSVNTDITTSMNNRKAALLDVKYVGDGDELYNYTGLVGVPYTLDPAGSPIMHNKFLIIDPTEPDRKLVTGSGNYTDGGWGNQDNAWLTITDPTIINKYLSKYNLMYNGSFHNRTATANPITTANGVTVHTLFSSEDGPWLVGNIVDTTIRAATESVFFETTAHDPTNSGTLDIDEAIWSVLDDAGKPNFFCEGVVNSMGGFAPTFSGTALTNYNSKGGYIRKSAVTSWDKHHSKYVVVDMDWVGVGSVNASKASSEYVGATGNDENHIFINDFRMARAFMREFSRHYAEDATVGSVDNTSVSEIHDWVAPDVPTGLSVTPAASSFDVSWTAPADPGDFSRYYVFITTNNNINTAKNEITEADGSFRSSFLRPEMQKKGRTTVTATLTTYNEGDALAAATDYYIGVVSVDKFGNESAALTGGPYQLSVGPNNPPNSPASLQQYKSDGTTVIAVGAQTTETTVVLKGTVSDPDVNTVKLQVEVRPTGTAFSNTFTHESALVASGNTASVNVSGLTSGTTYHWQARAVDSAAAASSWVIFNGADGNHFVVQTPAVITTGEKYPTLGETVSEAPWSDDTWVTPTNIYSDNAVTANVTAATFDNGDQTFVLKATGFDFSSIPDGSTINGVIVRVNSWYRSGQGSGSIDLLQLLDTSKAKVGTNQCATPVALTTTDTTIITKGSSSDLWGNALTAAWVKNANFGVAIGILATANNADVDVDYVTIEIYYTPGVNSAPNAPTGGTTTPDGSVSWINDNTPTFAWTFNDPDAGDSQKYFQLTTSLGHDSGQTLSGVSSYTPGSSLSDGNQTWQVRTWDQSSEVSPYSTAWTVKIDATPPTTPGSLDAGYNGTSSTLTWTASTDVTSGLKTYNVYRATYAFTATTNPNVTKLNGSDFTTASWDDTTVSAGQTYHYGITAVDNATNISALSNIKSVSTTGAGSTNLLPSATGQWHFGFEPGGATVDTQLCWQEPGAGSTLVDNLGFASSHEGARVCRFDNLTSAYGARTIISATCTVTAGNNYSVGVWAYVPALAGVITDVKFRIGIKWYNSVGTFLSENLNSDLTLSAYDTWQKLTYTNVTAPAGATGGRLLVDAYESNALDYDPYLDDAEFISVSPPADTSAPTNVGLLTPANNTVNVSTTTTLTVNTASDATPPISYYIQLALDSAFTSGVQFEDWDSANTTWSPTLANDTTYYWRVKAKDSASTPNETTYKGHTLDTDGYGKFVTISSTTINNPPLAPASLGGADVVSGLWKNSNQPSFEFTLDDPDNNNVKYRIVIDDSADFLSPVVDYTSALAAEGLRTFTVGQAAGGGSYTTGSAGQTLADSAGYYWQVKCIDEPGAESSYSVANGGAIAFKVDTSVAAPTSLDAGYNGTNASTLTWTAGDLSPSGLKTYNIYRATYAFTATTNPNVTKLNAVDITVTNYTDYPAPGQTYYYGVTAVDNATNVSSLSNTKSVVVSVTGHIVISEIQIDGATATDEFVELYNPTDTDIVMSGWRLRRKTSTGVEDTLVATLNGTILAHGFFLIGGIGYDGPVSTNTQYSNTSYNISADACVILYSDAGVTVVDKVGMGAAVDYETAAYGTNPAANRSIERKANTDSTATTMAAGGVDELKGNGYDTDNNLNDFVYRTTSDPQNTNSQREPAIANITLSNYDVNPDTAIVTQPFTYTVQYRNAVSGNVPPDTAQVFIDGTAYNLVYQGGAYDVLATFQYSTTLSTGIHNYYFYFVKGPDSARAPATSPEVFNGPCVGPQLEYMTAYSSPTANPPDGNDVALLPTKSLWAFLKPASNTPLGQSNWSGYTATIYWSTSNAISTPPWTYTRSRTMTFGVSDTSWNWDKFYVVFSSGVDYFAGNYVNYYIIANDAAGNQIIDDKGDTNSDNWVALGENTVIDNCHYFRITTSQPSDGVYDKKIAVKTEPTITSDADRFYNDFDWTGAMIFGDAVDDDYPNNLVYNNDDVGLQVSVSPGGIAATCTFYYTTDGSIPTLATPNYFSGGASQLNNNNWYKIDGSLADLHGFFPSDLNAAGCTIQILAAVYDGEPANNGTSGEPYQQLFKYYVLKEPGTPPGDNDNAIVMGRGNRDGRYPTTDFNNYSPLRHSSTETLTTTNLTRYLSPRTSPLSDDLMLNANFLTALGTDGMTDVFYSDQVQFYLRTAFMDVSEVAGTWSGNQAFIVWQATTTAFWTQAALTNGSTSGDDNQAPHLLKYHWLIGENTGLEGYASNPSDCTKGAPEGATVKYIFKVRDNQSAGAFRWIYKDPTTTRQRLTDTASTAQAANSQFEYKVLQDDYTRPVAYMPENIPGVITKSSMTAPSWPTQVLGDTVTACGSTIEPVRIYVGLFDTADGRFVFGNISSTECVANPNYQHRTFRDPNITNANYFGNDVLAVNTSTNSADSGIKGGRTADNSEGLEARMDEGRRYVHDVVCYYVLKKPASTNPTVQWSWIDSDGTVNGSANTEANAVADPFGTNLADSFKQYIRIENVDGATEHNYTGTAAETAGDYTGLVRMAPTTNVDADGNGIWFADISVPEISTACPFLYYRIWACNGDNDPQAYNLERHGGLLIDASGIPPTGTAANSITYCQPHNKTNSRWGYAIGNPYGKTFSDDDTCICGRVHDRDYGWVDITRYAGKVTSPPRVEIKSRVTVGGVTRTITTYLKVDPTTRRPTNIISTQVGAE